MNNVIKINKPFLGSDEFIATARQVILDIVRQQLDPTDEAKLSIDDIYEVTHSYILGNQKAMISTTLPDGKYYEVTYDKANDLMYVDCYVKYVQHVFGIDLSE